MEAGRSLRLKANVMDSRGPCALCGDSIRPNGVECFVEGSNEIVCGACAGDEAPELMSLLKLGEGFVVEDTEPTILPLAVAA